MMLVSSENESIIGTFKKIGKSNEHNFATFLQK